MTKVTICNVLGIKRLIVSEDFSIVMRMIKGYQNEGFITLHKPEENIAISIRVSDIVEILEVKNNA